MEKMHCMMVWNISAAGISIFSTGPVTSFFFSLLMFWWKLLLLLFVSGSMPFSFCWLIGSREEEFFFQEKEKEAGSWVRTEADSGKEVVIHPIHESLCSPSFQRTVDLLRRCSLQSVVHWSEIFPDNEKYSQQGVQLTYATSENMILPKQNHVNTGITKFTSPREYLHVFSYRESKHGLMWRDEYESIVDVILSHDSSDELLVTNSKKKKVATANSCLCSGWWCERGGCYVTAGGKTCCCLCSFATHPHPCFWMKGMSAGGGWELWVRGMEKQNRKMRITFHGIGFDKHDSPFS